MTIKTYALIYCLESGSVSFSNEIIDTDFSYNPILEDDLFIEIFFPGIDDNLVKDAFLEALEDFSHASFLTRKFCKNPYDCDYSELEEKQIRTNATLAVEQFLENLKRKI